MVSGIGCFGIHTLISHIHRIWAEYLVDQQGFVGVYFNIHLEALEQVIRVDQQS